MFDINRMFETEMSFCDSFTDRVNTEWGRIYYNPLNPLSHDSNHAHIMKDLCRPEMALEEIKAFFRKEGLTPRIYHSFLKDELKILGPHLQKAGFTVKTENARAFWFSSDMPTGPDSSSSVRRITEISSDIIEVIRSEDSGDWQINVLRRHVHDREFHLLGLFEAGKCVSIASVKTMDGYSRVDEVLTHLSYRGKHFGTRLIEYLVRYHRIISDNYLYLWATNPIAIRMYLGSASKRYKSQHPIGRPPQNDKDNGFNLELPLLGGLVGPSFCC